MYASAISTAETITASAIHSTIPLVQSFSAAPASQKPLQPQNPEQQSLEEVHFVAMPPHPHCCVFWLQKFPQHSESLLHCTVSFQQPHLLFVLHKPVQQSVFSEQPAVSGAQSHFPPVHFPEQQFPFTVHCVPVPPHPQCPALQFPSQHSLPSAHCSCVFLQGTQVQPIAAQPTGLLSKSVHPTFGSEPPDDGVHAPSRLQLPPKKTQQSLSDIFVKSTPAVKLVHFPELGMTLPHGFTQVQPIASHPGWLLSK